MLKIASQNTVNLHNVILVEGDGLKLPFTNQAFDIVITRLAEYSPHEVYRVLKNGGFFFIYDLGLEANKEILEYFKERIEEENFFFPKNLKKWKREVSKNVENAGFIVNSIEEFKENKYYQT